MKLSIKSLPETLFVNPEAGNPVVNGDPAKSCCNANMFTPAVFDKLATAANCAAAVLAFEVVPPVKPAPLMQLKII